jgi:hypothetical protein
MSHKLLRRVLELDEKASKDLTAPKGECDSFGDTCIVLDAHRFYRLTISAMTLSDLGGLE